MLRQGVLLALVLTGMALPVWGQQKPESKPAARVIVASPLGLTVGQRQKVLLRGLGLAKAREVRLEGLDAKIKILKKGTAAVPGRQVPEQVGNTEVEIEIELPADPGRDEGLLVVSTPAGDSPPHRLVIDRSPPVLEKEPNPGFSQAQEVTLPCLLTGLVGSPQDVDVFRFVGKRGERIRVEVQAAGLGSPLDAFLILTDERGTIVKASDDQAGQADPHFEILLPAEGTYFLSLLDAHDQGGPAHVYRLSLRREK